jgi:glutamate 5-kinase
VVRPRPVRLGARKLWIAFAVGARGRIDVDEGARAALVERHGSLLAAGVRDVRGSFLPGDAVELAGPDGVVFAKGLVTVSTEALQASAGRRTADLPPGTPQEVVHRDDLVMVPA